MTYFIAASQSLVPGGEMMGKCRVTKYEALKEMRAEAGERPRWGGMASTGRSPFTGISAGSSMNTGFPEAVWA